MPIGWITTRWPSLTQLKTSVELCPATLTSISTLTLNTFRMRRPWTDACGSARLRSILSVAIFGSLPAAAVVKPDLRRKRRQVAGAARLQCRRVCQCRRRVPIFDGRLLRHGDASENENCRPLLRSEGHVTFIFKVNRASRIERVGIENLLIPLRLAPQAV